MTPWIRQLSTTWITIASILPALGFADDDDVIPHAQSKAPGKALSPAEAIKKMVVPEGFTVELVASEPDIVNPVAMTFDERGRVWITESLEYPRSEPGKGRDRVKVLEDTNGDGKADRFTIFAEGLNIPSGIAVGHGGVWVANSPDILFYQDTDGDGKADTKEVVVTGFGRDDTHELPNSLTWGPDGWLYGWNGVFNRSVVNHRGKTHDFTCAIFRIHPKTREFELFCEGTSNPWGITFDTEGATFASACVIDHLWHLTETGYYHRQGGPYPPYIWKIESIADHKHQQAAYCGIHYFDSDAYPAQYRERLYLGNVHAGSINVDILKRGGPTYIASEAPDFLRANDAWFMPVSQKTGPDGSLYILDWYDRYHCYQDARRDSEGIDRLKGRLYRIRYKDTPRAPKFDLANESDDSLIGRLSSPNIYFRDIAQRLLAERATKPSRESLQALVLDSKASRKGRLHALWALVGGGDLDPAFHQELLRQDDPTFRAWGVRAAGNQHKVDPEVREIVVKAASDPSEDVRLQVAIASKKIEGVDALPILSEILSRSSKREGADARPADSEVIMLSENQYSLIPKIVWRNLEPMLEDRRTASRWVESLKSLSLTDSPPILDLIPRIVSRIMSRPNPAEVNIASVVQRLIDTDGKKATRTAVEILDEVASKIQTGEFQEETEVALKSQFEPICLRVLKTKEPLGLLYAAGRLAATFNIPDGIKQTREVLLIPNLNHESRIDALSALIAADDPSVLDRIDQFLIGERGQRSDDKQADFLALLGRVDQNRVAEIVLKHYAAMEPDAQPKAVELLTERPQWTLALLDAIAKKTIDRNVLNINQLRNLQASQSLELIKALKAEYGTIRSGRNPGREAAIRVVREFLDKTPGKPKQGAVVFQKVCGQCHKIYGEGQEVGPEITRNGRGSYDQILSNVLDPSLVIGSAFQGTTVATNDGRVVSGLIVEDGPQRIVLKLQGGKLETIGRADVDTVKKSDLSLMPEELEKQLTPQELADLFAYITLDLPPTDPKASPIPGAEGLHKNR